MTKSFLATWNNKAKCFSASFSPPISFSGDHFWRLSLRRVYIKCVPSEIVGLVVLWPLALVSENLEKKIIGQTQLSILDICLLDSTIDAGTSLVYSPTSFQSSLYSGPSNLEQISFRLHPLFAEDLPEILRFTDLIRSGFVEILFSNEYSGLI